MVELEEDQRRDLQRIREEAEAEQRRLEVEEERRRQREQRRRRREDDARNQELERELEKHAQEVVEVSPELSPASDWSMRSGSNDPRQPSTSSGSCYRRSNRRAVGRPK